MPYQLVSGTLTINPPLPGGNAGIASVVGDQLVVTLNGESQAFPLADVRAIFYNGAKGGGDTFVNATGLLGIHYGWNGRNTFTAGSHQDYCFLWGNDNAVRRPSGGFVVAYGHGGRNVYDPGVIAF